MGKALPVDRHLIDYLPPVLRKVREFQAINEANEPEFALAWAAIQLLLENQFLDTATEVGVSVWEKELKIRPKGTDILSARKARIKAMWNLRRPYTVPWLRQWLAAQCGQNGYTLDIEDYTILLELIDHDGDPDELFKTVEQIRPEDMILRPILTQNISATLYTAGYFATWTSTRLPVLPQEYVILLDENGAALTDENGAVLLDAEEI